ncbi:hypothetical protein LEP1GSC044_3721 [Leptospira kirschneri serovar Grippotyphosa str. RM52]|nr:hypothetical protein LEP1GSC044_3721 [Leptospira kirschneri serovar Grippotyphosa str. RM52]EMK05625.1 hypothetical protein LEP1GSC176_2195 [Leptospira kirschneri str. MMD1493]
MQRFILHSKNLSQLLGQILIKQKFFLNNASSILSNSSPLRFLIKCSDLSLDALIL